MHAHRARADGKAVRRGYDVISAVREIAGLGVFIVPTAVHSLNGFIRSFIDGVLYVCRVGYTFVV